MIPQIKTAKLKAKYPKVLRSKRILWCFVMSYLKEERKVTNKERKTLASIKVTVKCLSFLVGLVLTDNSFFTGCNIGE